MLSSRNRLLYLPLMLIAGCAASIDIHDGDTISKDRAYVLLSVRYSIERPDVDDKTIRDVSVGLTRLEPGKRPVNLAMSSVKNGQLFVLEVPPGVYFLRRIESFGGFFWSEFNPRQTIFVAKVGQINYPGEWIVTGSLEHRYAYSADLIMSLHVQSDHDVVNRFSHDYPLLNAKLPLQQTKMQDR